MKTKQVIYAGVIIAIGVLIPQIFHMIGGPGLGAILLPMHLSVLVAGFLLSPIAALCVGMITPICSFIYTGGSMPAIPMLYLMIVELGIYGLSVSLLNQKFKQGIWISLIGGMIAGRLARGIMFVVLGQLVQITMPPAFGLVASFVQGIPGIIVQLIVLPPFIYMIQRRGWLAHD